VLIEAGHALKRHDFSQAHRYPTRYDPLVLPYEPVNLWNTLRDNGPHIFDRTAFPGLYRRMLARHSPATADALALTLDQRPGPREKWDELFGVAVVDRLIEIGMLTRSPAGYISCLRFVPCSSRLYISDGPDQSIPRMVWLGKDTLLLLKAMRKQFNGRRFARGLEIGSGTGLLTIELAQYCDDTVGVDINPRAVTCGTINQRINNVKNVEFRLSDAFENAPGTFDVVIGNVPFVFVPPEMRATSLHCHGGDDYGVDLQLRVLAELDTKLTTSGMAVFLCCSPVVKGIDILPTRMRERFQSLHLSFDFQPLFNKSAPEFLDFHDSFGIQYTWAYIVTVRRASTFRLTVQPPSPWTTFVSWTYLSLMRTAFRLGRKRDSAW
jgi:SAM-dependent methyltransferase